ncbi:MAG: cell wall hydrolase [Lachnospiraceae bacterium]|nr:cell wall hydrolase [Lachnospiraceae bacterium]
MRCRDVMKLASVCAAMLGLVYTLNGIAQEDQEPDHLDIVEDIEVIDLEEPAEQRPTAELEPGICIEQDEKTQEPEPDVSLDATDKEILMKIAVSEAEGESVKGKALVMLSVLNRVKSDEFPDTISEVVFQGTQYSPVLDGRYYSIIPDDDCLAALELVESGWDESQGAMYFENYGADSWHSRNLEFLFQEGNHRFYK